MIVIADTSPLHYLILVQAVDVLPRLFQRVLIPDEVCSELRHPSAPAEVQRWIEEPPLWLEVRSVVAAASSAIPDLDAGEEAAIRLAEQVGRAFLLMDDTKGRREATKRGIPSTGTLGVLQAASKNGYLSLHDVLPRLLRTNFYIVPGLVESLLLEEQSRTGSAD